MVFLAQKHIMIQTSFCIVFDKKFLTCTLYVNCFILSLTSNRQKWLLQFIIMYRYMAGVAKHWMQTDAHVSVHVSQVSVSESLLNAFKE